MWDDPGMRVNLLITELRTGGAERCLTELALGLQARGDSVRIMSLMSLPDRSRTELVDRIRESQLDVASCDVQSPVQLGSAVRRVRHWLQQDEPDVLQTFLFHANAVGALAARRQSGLACIAGVRVAQPSLPRTWLERKVAKRIRGVICVSQAVQAFVEQRWSLPDTVEIATIPNAIQVPAKDSIPPMDWSAIGLRGEGPVVLFVGRLHLQKGLDLLLQVAPELLQQHPTMRFVVVGEGPMQSQVEQCKDRLPAGRMICLPWQSDVWPLYAGADIVVLPSRYEGMPNVVLEAMAAGRCVLAANVEGVSELLGSQLARQSFPRENIASLKTKLSALLDSDDRDRLGAMNRERVDQEFSIDKMVDRYRNLYHQWADHH